MQTRLLRVPMSKVTFFLGVAATALIAVSSAAAANVLPNPGFETNCGGLPCSWTNNIAGTAVRDTTQFHTGTASYKLTPNNRGFQATGQSDCTNANIAAGSQAVSYWYRASAGVDGLAMTVNLYSNTGCTGGIGQTSFQPAPIITTGAWTQVTGNLNVPSAAKSFLITLAVGCTAGCNGTQSANFDDVSLNSGPTAVTLLSFHGSRTARGVHLTWRTAAANEIVGFNVYRGQLKLNRALLHGTQAGLQAGNYTWLDRTAGAAMRRPLSYRLQAVRLDGTRVWLGAVTVSS